MSCKTGLLMPAEEYKETLDIERFLTVEIDAKHDILAGSGILPAVATGNQGFFLDHIVKLIIEGWS